MDSRLMICQLAEKYNIRDMSFEDFPNAGIHTNYFLLALYRSYEINHFQPEDFLDFPIEVIIDYIQRTHRFYLEKKLPEISQTIYQLSKNLGGNQQGLYLLVANFFSHYKNMLIDHIHHEERDLLPFITALNKIVEYRHLSDYILHFSRYSLTNHHHEDAFEFKEVKEALLQYNANDFDPSLIRILLFQMHTLETDLHFHGMMEEMVLIPKAREIQIKAERMISHLSRLN